jgi:hypothetical protein
MQTVQTPAEPPNQGRMNLAMRGWIWKRRKAPRKMVRAKRRFFAGAFGKVE